MFEPLCSSVNTNCTGQWTHRVADSPPDHSSSKPLFANMASSIHDVCLELVSSRSKPKKVKGSAPKKVKREEELKDILSDFKLLCYLARYALYSPPLCLRQRLPGLGQLAFPSTLLRRFLRGCVVFTAHGLVTAPASVFVTARKKKIWMNRVFARVMSGFVVVPLQAAAADRIAGKSGVIDAAESGNVADVLSYLIADANCVNDRSVRREFLYLGVKVG